MKTTIAALVLALASTSALPQTCVATPPIIPAEKNHYCSLGGSTGSAQLYCGSTPNVAALERFSHSDVPAPGLTNGPIACAVTAVQCSACVPSNGNWVCPYTITTNACTGYPIGPDCDHQPSVIDVFHDTVCKAGYVLRGDQCHAQTMIDEDAAVLAAGGVVSRDPLGNLLQVHNAAHELVIDAGNYDALGRPGRVDDVSFGWPAGGSITPDVMIVGGWSLGLRWSLGLHWLAPFAQIDRITFGSTTYDYIYWPNDSVRNFSTYNRGIKIASSSWDAGGHVSTTAAALSAEPVTLPSVMMPGAHGVAVTRAGTPIPVQTPHIGVHQITMTPGGSLFQLGAITLGTTLLLPSNTMLLNRVASWAQCFAQEAVPEEREKACQLQFDKDYATCEGDAARFYGHPKAKTLKSQLKGAFLAQCRTSALQRMYECRHSPAGVAGIKTELDERELR